MLYQKEELLQKRTDLFGKGTFNQTTSVLSDLSIAAGIPSYFVALQNMNKEDVEVLDGLVNEYLRIDFAEDSSNGGKQQYATYEKMSSVLNEIIARTAA